MDNTKTKDDLSSIKAMMEKSSKFSSLSGMSILLTGLLAIIGATFVFFDIGFSVSEVEISYSQLISKKGTPEDLFLKIKLLVTIASDGLNFP